MRIPNRRREQSRKTERRLMTESLGLRNRLTMQRGDSELVEHVRCDGSREVTLIFHLGRREDDAGRWSKPTN